MTVRGGRRVFAAPARYLQGAGALDQLGEALRPIGDRPLVIADRFVMSMLGARLDRLLTSAGLRPEFRVLDGEITAAAADALAASCAERTYCVVVGTGGGKSIDAAKAVGIRLGLPVATVPTIASNDSPTSAAVAMYDDHHVLVSVDRMPRNPVAVVVDTELIARAPPEFLRAGIGDAISKKFEAEGCLAGTGQTPLGTRPLLIGTAIADACYRTIRRTAEAGLQACAARTVTGELEDLVEAIVLMSGLGFENGGLSLAHSLTRGLVSARGARAALHGYHVAWGTLVQLAAELRADGEIRELMSFHRSVGLPVSLPELGMKHPRPEEVAEIARLTMTAPHLANLAVKLQAEEVARAIGQIERIAARSGDLPAA